MPKKTTATTETLKKARANQIQLFLKTLNIDSDTSAGHLTLALDLTAQIAANNMKENE